MTLRIISGAQTGADIAGLWAGKLFGFKTGGYAPDGFMTLAGNHPEMATTFGIVEHSKGYRDRTIANLKESDLTLICSEKMSPGTRLTLNQCKKEGVPYTFFALDPADMQASLNNPEFVKVTNLIWNRLNVCNDQFTINVAGNSTQNSARSFEFAFKLCHKLFSELGYKSEVSASDWVMYQDKWE
jgi:hypothetical protein